MRQSAIGRKSRLIEALKWLARAMEAIARA
jgi:hypothetical protein